MSFMAASRADVESADFASADRHRNRVIHKNHFERTRMTTRAGSWKDTFWDRFAQFYIAAGIGGIAGGCLTAWQLGKGAPDLAGIAEIGLHSRPMLVSALVLGASSAYYLLIRTPSSGGRGAGWPFRLLMLLAAIGALAASNKFATDEMSVALTRPDRERVEETSTALVDVGRMRDRPLSSAQCSEGTRLLDNYEVRTLTGAELASAAYAHLYEHGCGDAQQYATQLRQLYIKARTTSGQEPPAQPHSKGALASLLPDNASLCLSEAEHLAAQKGHEASAAKRDACIDMKNADGRPAAFADLTDAPDQAAKR
jgi:hypothetical protein